MPVPSIWLSRSIGTKWVGSNRETKACSLLECTEPPIKKKQSNKDDHMFKSNSPEIFGS